MRQLAYRIIREVFGEEPNTVERLHGGAWALVYEVGLASRKVVVKIQAGSSTGLQMEEAVMRRLGSEGVRVPNPIISGEFREERVGYLVMSYVEGTLLEKAWRDLAQPEKTRLCQHFLEVLGTINRVVIDGYGPLFPNLEGPHTTLKDYLVHQVDKFAQCPVRSAIKDQVWNSLVTKLIKRADALANEKARLVHADFRMRNMIYKDGQVTLIDFGNSLGMLPSFDFYRFTRVDLSETMLSGAEVAMLAKNYSQGNPCYQRDVPLVKAILGMRLASFGATKGNKRLMTEFLGEIIEAESEL